jgi:hypothetical protein
MCRLISWLRICAPIPQARYLVQAAGHQPVIIRADRYRTDRVLVATQYHGVSRRIFCAQIPQTRSIVPAAGHQPVVIRADRYSGEGIALYKRSASYDTKCFSK